MTIFTVVPVKKLSNAKSRLSPIMSSDERKEFCLKMLEDVLTAVKSTKLIENVGVVSADTQAFEVTKRFEAHAIMEDLKGLNHAVSEGIGWSIKHGATSVLIIPSDIPLVKPQDLNNILFLGKTSSIVISPSEGDEGTNALLLTPPDIIQPFYGTHSFRRHVREAMSRKINFQLLKSPRIALDIDTVDDLCAFVKQNPQENCSYGFLKSRSVLSRLSVRKGKLV